MNRPPLPSNYEERVYAGVLGKIIGVYIGRPFEGWSHERIMEELGEIRNYVNKQRGLSQVLSDDDITGTFTFFRALTDRGCTPELTAEQIGESWLNYIIENKTILWWGGIGCSTEHTAWRRLAAGVKAPLSGSIELNGSTVAEQIGAQIFIDAWGLVNPGDPKRAADIAKLAGSVSHDGLSVHAAQVVAAMVAAAFVETDLDKIISVALDQIPANSLIRKVADDIRDWHTENPNDWKRTLTKIQEKYGYDKFPGNCHIVPNHALIHLALRHSGGDFNEGQMIVNTAGWDTDCNAANVGCILGVLKGLAGIDAGTDWRGPVADRILLSTADGGAAISDALREAFFIINAARKYRGLEALSPKNGARFHFSLPGSLQGFLAENPESLYLENKEPQGALTCSVPSVEGNRAAFTATFTTKENFTQGNYSMIACPTLHTGQTVKARWVASKENQTPMEVRLALKYSDQDQNLQLHSGPGIVIQPGSSETVEWQIPVVDRFPIAAIGFEILPGSQGTLHLESLDWKGAPTASLMPAKEGNDWPQAWIQNMENFMSHDKNETLILHHTRPGGFLMRGSRDWQDYRFRSRANIVLADSFGLIIRGQGLRRHYSLRITPDGFARIVKVCDGETILAEVKCTWILNQSRDYEILAKGDLIRATVDGIHILEARDSALAGGGAGFLMDQGRVLVETALVDPTV